MFRFFGLLSIFDWVTPALAVVDDVAHGEPLNLGEVWAFNIPYEDAARQGWSPDDVLGLMADRGINTWGAFLNFGYLTYHVSIEQAAWAEYCLNYYGIPIHNRSRGAPQVG